MDEDGTSNEDGLGGDGVQKLEMSPGRDGFPVPKKESGYNDDGLLLALLPQMFQISKDKQEILERKIQEKYPKGQEDIGQFKEKWLEDNNNMGT